MSKNRVIGGFEDSFERAGGAVASAAKQTVKDFTNTTKGQITGSVGKNSTQSDQGSNEHGSANPAPSPQVNDKSSSGHDQADSSGEQSGGMTDEERVSFLKDLYGKSNSDDESHKKTDTKGTLVKDMIGASQSDPNKGKSPEELAKIEALRRQLHGKYYQDLVNRPKPKEEPVAEKLEREEQQEKFEEIEKDKKKMTPSINPIQKQGTAEAAVGVSG